MAMSSSPPGPELLFTVPIPPCPPHPGGEVTATVVAKDVYLLTLRSPPDNRLTTAACAALLAALDELEFAHAPGVVLTTSAIPKFYSNGLDLEHARARGDAFFSASLYPLFRRLLTYPCPTVALVNGHAFAGGLMLAMHHDYRVMNPSRGFACLNELDFGVPLKAAMTGIFRAKTTPVAYRTLVLEARRMGGPEALAAGVVDALGGLDEALRLIADRGLAAKGRTGVYGVMKTDMYRETLAYLDGHEAEEKRASRLDEAEKARREQGKKNVAEGQGAVIRPPKGAKL